MYLFEERDEHTIFAASMMLDFILKGIQNLLSRENAMPCVVPKSERMASGQNEPEKKFGSR